MLLHDQATTVVIGRLVLELSLAIDPCVFPRDALAAQPIVDELALVHIDAGLHIDLHDVTETVGIIIAVAVAALTGQVTAGIIG